MLTKMCFWKSVTEEKMALYTIYIFLNHAYYFHWFLFFFLLLFIIQSSKKKQTTKPPQNPNPCLFFNRNSKNLTLTFTYFFQPIVFMENKTHFLCKFKICLFACLFSLSRASCILIYHCRVTWMSSCFLFFPFKEMMERQHIRYCEKGTH